MQTAGSILKVLRDIKYLDWTLYVDLRDQPWIQWRFMARDNDNPNSKPTLQKCRKWKLSYHMTDQEIERTAFLACKQAVEHEMCENYTFMGQQIHNPHIDPYVLADLLKSGDALVHREG